MTNEELERIGERIEITQAGLQVLSEHLDRIEKVMDSIDRPDPYAEGFNDGIEAERGRIMEIIADNCAPAITHKLFARITWEPRG